MICPLCHAHSSEYAPRVYQCGSCLLVFKDRADHISSSEESIRYSHHQNHAEDEGYKNFLNRLLLPLKSFLPEDFTALDFGCGPGPALAAMLQELGGEVHLYDPQFYHQDSVLNHCYDVVTCTEVVEHFREPSKSWEQLVGAVKPNGILAIMTQFLTQSTDYQKWWYKNDPTHIVFYGRETLEFIARKFNLEILFDDKHSVVIFKKL
jgi:SAM-dependent methyltransferase